MEFAKVVYFVVPRMLVRNALRQCSFRRSACSVKKITTRLLFWGDASRAFLKPCHIVVSRARESNRIQDVFCNYGRTSSIICSVDYPRSFPRCWNVSTHFFGFRRTPSLAMMSNPGMRRILLPTCLCHRPFRRCYRSKVDWHSLVAGLQERALRSYYAIYILRTRPAQMRYIRTSSLYSNTSGNL